MKAIFGGILSPRLLYIIPVIFLLLFFLYPLVAIFDRSLRPNGILQLEGFITLITNSYYRDTVWFTLWQAVISTIFTLICAIPTAFVFTRYQFPFKSVLLTLATLPFVLPTVVVATAFRALIDDNGVLNQLAMILFALDRPPIQLERTLTMIFIAHVFYNYPLALRMIYGYWANQSGRIEEAAQMLGANGWRLWIDIRLPIIRPIIWASGLLVFTFTFTSFGVILLLGGLRYATIEVEIYNQAMNLFNLPMAAVLSSVQMVILLSALNLYTRLQRNITIVSLQSQKAVVRKPRTTSEYIIVFITIGFMVFFLLAPLLALFLQSVTDKSGFTLRFFTDLGQVGRGSVFNVPPIEAVKNSALFASITTTLAVILGVLLAMLLHTQRKNRLIGWLDALVMLPLATSAVTLGFGFIIGFSSPPMVWRSEWWLIPISHTLVALPFVVRSVLPALRSIPKQIHEAGMMLGVGQWGRWYRLELPLVSKGVVVGAIFAFTVSLGEFGASLFIVRNNMPTISIVIYRFLGRAGTYGQALAMSVILLMVSAIAFLILERLRARGTGEF